MNVELISNLTQQYYESTSDNVVGVGYGYKSIDNKLTDEKSIVFTVNKKLPLNEVPETDLIPKTISLSGETFTTDVIEATIKFHQSCPPDFYNWATIPPQNRDKIRPLVGGLSTTNFTSASAYTSTLGFIAVDALTNSLVGVSCAHSFAENSSIIASEQNPTGTTSNILNNFIVQPNEQSNYGMQNAVGLVKRFYPLTITGTNYVDVALTTLNQSDIDLNTSYQQLGMTGWTAPLTFATTQEINGLISSKANLFSSGRTTGPKGEGEMKLRMFSTMTTLSVETTSQGQPVNLTFANCLGCIASATTTPQGDLCPYPIAEGDSGSALVADINGIRKIVGLVFAGAEQSGQTIYAYATRIDEIESAVVISPWTGQTVSYSNTGATQTNLEIGLSPNIITAPNNNIYWLAGTLKS
jgi:hypothetical protein